MRSRLALYLSAALIFFFGTTTSTIPAAARARFSRLLRASCSLRLFAASKLLSRASGCGSISLARSTGASSRTPTTPHVRDDASEPPDIAVLTERAGGHRTRAVGGVTRVVPSLFRVQRTPTDLI